MRSQSIYFPNFFLDTFVQPVTTHSEVDENENAYFVRVDAPGVKKEDVKVSLEHRQLVLEWERKGKGQYRKSYTLPDDVNTAEIAARLQDGVLELALPKSEAAKPKTIAIQDGSGSEGIFQKLLK
jgi:HSP20 family protein